MSEIGPRCEFCDREPQDCDCDFDTVGLAIYGPCLDAEHPKRIATLEAELAASREKLEGREVVLRHAEQRIAQLEQALSEMTVQLGVSEAKLAFILREWVLPEHLEEALADLESELLKAKG